MSDHDDAVERHVRECPRCAALLSWTGSALTDPPLDDGWQSRVRSRIHAELTPVRPLPSGGAAVGGALLLMLGVAAALALYKGTGGWEGLTATQAAGLVPLFVAGITLATLSLWDSIRPGSRQLVSPWIPLGLVSVGFLVLLWALFPSIPRTDLIATGRKCLLGGLGLSAFTGAVTYLFVRLGYPVDAKRSGALAGSLAGTLAAVGLQVSCHDNEFVHLLTSHWVVVPIAISCGYYLGRRVRA